MKISMITPIYATTTTAENGTPVVHYFTKEWVKMGHEVTVYHIASRFPRLYYWLSKHFHHQLDTRLGIRVPLIRPADDDYEADGVTIHRRCYNKIIPHALYTKNQIKRIMRIIEKDCVDNGVPDWFIGHWDNPQLVLLTELKKRFDKPTCLVLHGNEYDFEQKYGAEGLKMLQKLDVIGFRSVVGQNNFIKKYGQPFRSFVASSGVSANFLKAGIEAKKEINQTIHNFVYVGTLIGRKHPVAVLTALTQAFPDGDFSLIYIGDGAEREIIEEEFIRKGSIGNVQFTGRISRDEIIDYLEKSDVFVMVSEHETFGLVYLEAMAFGLIAIGSKNEGIDGVIKDGVNGFLCEAGNVNDLTNTISRIKKMSREQLKDISLKAKQTAEEYSDTGVAEKYLNALIH